MRRPVVMPAVGLYLWATFSSKTCLHLASLNTVYGELVITSSCLQGIKANYIWITLILKVKSALILRRIVTIIFTMISKQICACLFTIHFRANNILRNCNSHMYINICFESLCCDLCNVFASPSTPLYPCADSCQCLLQIISSHFARSKIPSATVS